MRTKSRVKLVNWASTELGSPYIFGAAGQRCTPAYRQQVMKNKPEYAQAIQANCPVLSSKQLSCSGCKYDGCKAYDCRGLTREGLRAVTGRPVMGAGATSQWNDAGNWEIKGPIQAMPEKSCLVFVQKGSTISGTKAANRPQFQKLIEDCRSGLVDGIVTKSVSRFGRNTVDTLVYTRELRALGIDVYFEKENIHSCSAEGELLLTLMAAFAESESVSMSDNIKWGKQRRYEKGLVESLAG